MSRGSEFTDYSNVWIVYVLVLRIKGIEGGKEGLEGTEPPGEGKKDNKSDSPNLGRKRREKSGVR